ncbi:MAG: hypothetical protein EOO77_42880, partial [Oxalobacteraceae bacterium]
MAAARTSAHKPNKSSAPAAKRPTGRPKKAASEVAEHTVAVRFTEGGKAVLESLLESERLLLRQRGTSPEDAARLSAAHLLRSLVYQEAQRRG